MKFEQKWYAGVKKENRCQEYFPAIVPGNVQRDYAAHIGILEDIMFGDNVTKLEETEGWTWEALRKILCKKESKQIRK